MIKSLTRCPLFFLSCVPHCAMCTSFLISTVHFKMDWVHTIARAWIAPVMSRKVYDAKVVLVVDHQVLPSMELSGRAITLVALNKEAS